MALTQISTSGIKDATIATADIADQAITSAKIANGTIDNVDISTNAAITGGKLADNSVSLAKLEHGTSSNNGKFLRANNGADPTFETIDLVADTSPQLGGDLQTNGNDITFSDNNKAIFGNSGDFEIYHAPNAGFIDCTNSFALYIQSDDIRLFSEDGNELYFKGVKDGAVELYYDNTKKFETTSAGATVTGDLNVTNINVASDIGHLNDTDTKIVFSDNQIEIFTANSQALDIKSNGAMEFGHGSEISFNSDEAIRLNIPTNTDLNNLGNNRDDKGKITIAAGDADNATPDDDCTVLQITPQQTRSSTVGSKHGGIAWQHLSPLNWTGYQGNQIWMGSSLHDTVGQERANFQIWMNNQTGQGSQPNNHAFNLSPEGYHSFPKTPIYIGKGTNYTQSASAYSDVAPNSDETIRGITRSGAEFTVPEDGIYCFNLSALWHPGGENNYYSSRILVNGSQIGNIVQGGQTQTQHGHFNYFQLVSVSASDVIKYQFKAAGGKVYSSQANWALYKVA